MWGIMLNDPLEILQGSMVVLGVEGAEASQCQQGVVVSALLCCQQLLTHVQGGPGLSLQEVTVCQPDTELPAGPWADVQEQLDCLDDRREQLSATTAPELSPGTHSLPVCCKPPLQGSSGLLLDLLSVTG